MNKKAYLAQEHEHYKELGLTKKVQLWENGMRNSGKKRTFEWWYADAEYTNGMKSVLTFYTKNHFDIAGPANPTATIQLTFPDGTVYEDEISEGENSVIKASKDICNVMIGKNSIRYVDGNYVIHYENNDVNFDCIMKPKMPMWRPATGHCYYGNTKEHYFAWLAVQPSAFVNTTLNYKNETYTLEGNGYHDHNWGNTPMQKLLNNWYWCRANVGPYTIISVDLIATKKYDHEQVIPFLIAKDGAVVADDASKVTVERLETICHPVTNKSIDNRLVFKYEDGNEKYTVEYIRERDIEATNLIDSMGLSKFKKALAHKLKINPTYIRILGTVKLMVEVNGTKEVYEEEGLWEQMFFGNDYK